MNADDGTDGRATPVVRPLSPVDLDQASKLALRVFRACVAESCEPEGLGFFASCVSPEALEQAIARGALALGAFTDQGMTGMLVVRKPGHVANFFVDASRQRQGAGRSLFEEALARLRHPDGEAPAITVNASLVSVPFYERLGFSRAGNEQCEQGMRFVPMRRPGER